MKNKSQPRFQRLAIRIAALALFLIASGQSWGNWQFHQGQMALNKKDFTMALKNFEKAESRLGADPDLLYQKGQAAYLLGLEMKDTNRLQKASSAFEELTRRLPFYGRAWLYWALSRQSIESLSADRLNPMEWKEIKPLFEKAQAREPHSSWIAYMIARHMFLADKVLSPEERAAAFGLLQKSLQVHYPYQASYNLEPALSFLWKKFRNFKMLLAVTPKDVFSYHKLLQFMDKNQIWVFREKVSRSFSKLRIPVYEELCRKGEAFLKKGAREEAFIFFQSAYWLDYSSLRAKAGMIAARPEQKPWTDEEYQWLQGILEKEEENISFAFSFLDKSLDEFPFGNPQAYFKGLLELRREKGAEAASWFLKVQDKVPYPSLRRYLALSFWQAGENQKAYETLLPALEETYPDLREVYLLKDWNGKRPLVNAQNISKKIEEIATRESFADNWSDARSQKFLNVLTPESSQTGVVVNLKPGRVSMYLQVRNRSTGKNRYAFAMLTLWEGNTGKEIAEIYQSNEAWAERRFDITTSGGQRWLEVRLMNRPQGTKQNGPELEIGTLRVDYL